MTPNPDHHFHYVSAIDSDRRFLIAGPYSSHEAALARVDVVRAYACDFSKNASAGRAAFMAWGTASSAEPLKTALGAHTGADMPQATVTESSVNRIRALYAAWVGYDPISECGVAPLQALQTLREFRAEAGGKVAA